MHRQRTAFFRNPIVSILVLILSACASSNQPSPTILGLTQQSSNTPPQASLTLHPETTPAPFFYPTDTVAIRKTATMLVTPTAIISPLSTYTDCSPSEITKYLDVVLPLADEHAIDTYEAQKMEGLIDQGQILAFRDEAVMRLKSIQEIQAPSCLMVAHEKMTESFELLISTWDLISVKDYSTATTTLQQCYEALGEAIAMITLIKPE